MKNRRVFLFCCITISLAFTGAGQSLPPGHSTECMSNSGSPACQNPVYTDNLSEYLYDLRTSWTFNNGVPDDSGPTVFEGGSAGNLKTQQKDSVTGEEKTEYFIQNPGNAGTYSFGRGNLQNTDIQITNSKKGSNQLGEYLINPPYKGQCGDGKIDPGETSSNCPEDLGTPESVIINGFTPSKNIEYVESDYKDITLSDDIVHVRDNITLDASGSGSPDYYVENDSIIENELENELKNIETITHHAFLPSPGADNHYDNSSDTKRTYPSGWGKNPTPLCTDVEIQESSLSKWFVIKPDLFSNTTTVVAPGSQKYTAVDNYSSSLQEAVIDYSSGWNENSGEPWYGCEQSNYYYVDCEQSNLPEEINECTNPNAYGTISYYPNQGTTPIHTVRTVNVPVNYIDYWIEEQAVWGPVNQNPSMFGGLDVKDTNFGYHTVPDNDDRQGANDESVSANHYSLKTESNNFVAERVTSNVADADGPDGQSDGLIGYHENEGIKGKTGSVLEREIWKNNPGNYLGIDPSILECPGETIRCLISVDVSTKPDGWGTNPGNSFKVEKQK